MEQYLLDFQKLASFDEEDYMVTSSNYHAVEWVSKWPNSGSGIYKNICCIVGESGGGKTHLANIWARKSSALSVSKDYLSKKRYIEDNVMAYVLDEVSDFLDDEVPLFHFFEDVIARDKGLMILSPVLIEKLAITLPDLRSRLKSFLVLQITKPDENMIRHILTKYFSDRQVTVKSDVLNYLVSRLKFSYKEIAKTVEKLDKASLVEQKTISIPFIKKVIGL